jgi:para-nitrobenzyl esterase
VLPNHPCDPSAPSISTDVPLIVGTNEHEFVNGVDNPEAVTLTFADVSARAAKIFGKRAGEIVDAYRSCYSGRTAFDVYAAMMTSAVRSAAFTQASRKAAQNGAKVYEYIYSWRTPVLSGRPGTFHSAEIAMAFNNARYCENYTGGGPEAVQMATRISGSWAAMAKKGSPQNESIPTWPAFGAKMETMVFDNECKVVRNPEGEARNLVDKALGDIDGAK